MISLNQKCQQCGINSNFPGVRINQRNCNYCRQRQELYLKNIPASDFCYSPPLKHSLKKKLKIAMESYFAKLSKKKGVHGILAYSGGIDSTYVLDMLVNKYELNIMPITVDVGSLNNRALVNIKQTIKKLKIKKHLFIKNHKKLFLKINKFFLKNLHLLPVKGYNPSCCMVCHHLVDLIIYKIANQYNVDFIASGLDRYQTPPELNFLLNSDSFFISPSSDNYLETLTKFWPKEILNKTLTDKELNWLNQCTKSQKPIKIIYPTWLLDYNKEQAGEQLLKRKIIVNKTNTNCYFAFVANLLHEKKFGYGIDEFVTSNKTWESKQPS